MEDFMFCQKEIIGKEIYGICYIYSSYSVFFSQSTEVNKKHSCMCGGLMVARCPPSSSSTPHPQQVRGKNMKKSSWVNIKTGRSLTISYHRQNRLNLGNVN